MEMMKMAIWEMPLTYLIISVILTWGIGLSIPLLLRYVFLRRPINKTPAIVIVVILLFLQLALWISLGSTSKTHFVLLLIAYISYYILRKGNKGEHKVVKDKDKNQRRGVADHFYIGSATQPEKEAGRYPHKADTKAKDCRKKCTPDADSYGGEEALKQ